jgi:hypothetical protein
LGTGESPTKKILLGEFDEMKGEDDDHLYLGDELLLSKEKARDI